MQQHLPFSGDFNGSSADELVQEAATVYLDPRNRLAAQGPDALSDIDCLTLLLGERDYLLATKLLFGFGSLTGVSRASLAQLSAFLTPEKAMRLLAAFRFAALCASESSRASPFRREILCVTLVDARFRPLKKVRVSVGTLNESLAHPREIFKAAITHSAYGFVLFLPLLRLRPRFKRQFTRSSSRSRKCPVRR
jgi:DNA repair protein RadC